MGFFEAIYTTCIKKYFVFSGRASRSEFWWFKLTYIVLSICFAIMVAFLPIDFLFHTTYLFTIKPLILIFIIIVEIPNITVTARRLHDKNMSGFWVILLFASLVIHLTSFYFDANFKDGIIGNISSILGLIQLVFLILFMFKGTDGSNKYGPDPLKPHVDAKVFS